VLLLLLLLLAACWRPAEHNASLLAGACLAPSLLLRAATGAVTKLLLLAY
jgi:hypothetical protein